MRFSTAFYYSVLFLFVNELYPSRARGIGFGVGSAAGAIASTLGNLIIGIL
jgi:MFS family permease